MMPVNFCGLKDDTIIVVCMADAPAGTVGRVGIPKAEKSIERIMVNMNDRHDYQVALYFADWDDKCRQLAVDTFDEGTLSLICNICNPHLADSGFLIRNLPLC